MLALAFASGASGRSAAAEPTVAPYGSWRSPISAELLVKDSVGFGDLVLDGQTLYWVERRPEEQGRYAIVRRAPDGTIDDVLPAPLSARTLVNEYGGGALLASEGIVYFTNYADQRLWRVVPGETPQPITAEGPLRFADFVRDPLRNRLISVCEDHSREGQEAVTRIVAVDLASGAVSPLVEGADFYSNPRVSPDGSQLAWLAWNHPNMPWDGTELHVAPLAADGTPGQSRLVAGGDQESIFQPAWAPDGVLYFVSDRTDWWNLYARREGRIEALLPLEAEFGRPQWVFGLTTYGISPAGRIVAAYSQDGRWSLVQIDPKSGEHQLIHQPYTNVWSVLVGSGRVYSEVSSPTAGESLVEIQLPSGAAEVIRRSSPFEPDAKYTSIPEAIEFPTDGGRTAHALYYPPTNGDFRGPAGELPPLIIAVHGGPTAATAAQFRLSTQYWTSRGFGVCDVNYGGSTGYGRPYRNRLRDAWGIVDVADATNAALYLAEQGKVDRNKLIVRGGSAGGYTTLACLAFRDVFCCGASYFGISDLALLARETHKFESRYLDRLVGRYPEDEPIYRERSPIYHLEGFDRPIILLQGLEDKVVPPNQAEMVFESLDRRGVPVAYVPFEGEQHGFRQAENIIRAQEAELYFYSRVLGFELPEKIEPVDIHNLPAP